MRRGWNRDKYSECPECGKKGKYSARGTDPTFKTRCKYCKHIVLRTEAEKRQAKKRQAKSPAWLIANKTARETAHGSTGPKWGEGCACGCTEFPASTQNYLRKKTEWQVHRREMKRLKEANHE